MINANQPCPCGTGEPYAHCCQPLHDGIAQATTAQALMRSRYAAFALGQELASAGEYLWRTWHPRTRPESVAADDGPVWTGLEILEIVDGTENDADGIVEFIANYREGRRGAQMRERSRFERRAGRWFYVDGDVR